MYRAWGDDVVGSDVVESHDSGDKQEMRLTGRIDAQSVDESSILGHHRAKPAAGGLQSFWFSCPCTLLWVIQSGRTVIIRAGQGNAVVSKPLVKNQLREEGA